MFYSKEERHYMLYILLFSRICNTSLLELQDFFCVSKNTIVNDISEIRNTLKNNSIKIIYRRDIGYKLKGDNFTIRSIAFRFINNLWEKDNGKRLLFKGLLYINNSYYANVRCDFEQLIKKLKVKVVKSRFESITYFISYLNLNAKFDCVKLNSGDKKLLDSTTIYKSIKTYNNYSYKDYESEKYYLTILIFIVAEAVHNEESLLFLKRCTQEIVYEFERVSASWIKDREELLDSLYNHLVPAFFRIKYSFKIDNPLMKEIYNQYSDIFNILKVALEPFKKLTNMDIPDQEIGYFTILFGSHVTKPQDRRTKAIVVCPNGISSSTIMKSELLTLFPEIDFLELDQMIDYSKNLEIYKDIDMVFSTLPIETSIPNFVIKPLMTELEKYELIQKVSNKFKLKKRNIISVEDIVTSIMPYIKLRDNMTQNELMRIVQQKINRRVKEKLDNRPRLSELLNANRIRFVDTSFDWKKSIRLSIQPLLEEGVINKEYIDAIIKKLEEYGAFIDLGHNVALPHASPEDGANKIGFSMMFCRESVYLLDDRNHPINLFIGLSVIDNRMHLRALSTLTRLLSDSLTLEKLYNSKSPDDVISIIKEVEAKENMD